MSGGSDLSGTWHGIFNYPDTLPANGFLAQIADSGGRLSGTIDEVDAVERVGTPMSAMIDGTRAGSGVRFTKFYAENAGSYDVVDYAGEVSADGCEITGRWQIAGAWGGSFIMTRAAADAVDVAVREEVEAPVGRPAEE